MKDWNLFSKNIDFFDFFFVIQDKQLVLIALAFTFTPMNVSNFRKNC